eukprot:2035419-Lingulodinium_polyedra.AAC.1
MDCGLLRGSGVQAQVAASGTRSSSGGVGRAAQRRPQRLVGHGAGTRGGRPWHAGRAARRLVAGARRAVR